MKWNSFSNSNVWNRVYVWRPLRRGHPLGPKINKLLSYISFPYTRRTCTYHLQKNNHFKQTTVYKSFILSFACDNNKCKKKKIQNKGKKRYENHKKESQGLKKKFRKLRHVIFIFFIFLCINSINFVYSCRYVKQNERRKLFLTHYANKRYTHTIS